MGWLTLGLIPLPAGYEYPALAYGEAGQENSGHEEYASIPDEGIEPLCEEGEPSYPEQENEPEFPEEPGKESDEEPSDELNEGENGSIPPEDKYECEDYEYKEEYEPYPPEDEVGLGIAFTFDDLVLEMYELYTGVDVMALLLRGVAAVDETGEYVTHLIMVGDDGGFADYIRENFAHIAGPVTGVGPDPLPEGDVFGSFPGLLSMLADIALSLDADYTYEAAEGFHTEGQLEFAFEAQVTYSVVHPQDQDLVAVSEYRDLFVNFMPIVPTSITSWAALNAAVQAAPAGDSTIVLDAHIPNENHSQITIPTGRNITLASGAGGPFTLTQGATNQRHFVVDNGSTLRLENVVLSGNQQNILVNHGGVMVNDGGI